MEVGFQVAPLLLDGREAQAAERACLGADGTAGRGGRCTRGRRGAGTVELGLQGRVGDILRGQGQDKVGRKVVDWRDMSFADSFGGVGRGISYGTMDAVARPFRRLAL